MTNEPPEFDEAVKGTRIKDLGLAIAGTSLEPILEVFRLEIARAGLGRIEPRFYLSNEWGVPSGTIAIAIPFYLARPDLAQVQKYHAGYVEGLEPGQMLRYLRHEFGHVVNYAYNLHQRTDWTEHFGSFNAPYPDDYRPVPFDRRFVRHLPGWYAQKHPDEDFAETFAVWMTPGDTWRTTYADRPVALEKLEYCDRVVREFSSLPPLVTAVDLDEDVADIEAKLGEFYTSLGADDHGLPAGLDALLRDDFAENLPDSAGESATVANLLRHLRSDLCSSVFQWTGHSPDHVNTLVNRLIDRAEVMRLLYHPAQEQTAVVQLTAMVSALAMKYVVNGDYES